MAHESESPEAARQGTCHVLLTARLRQYWVPPDGVLVYANSRILLPAIGNFDGQRWRVGCTPNAAQAGKEQPPIKTPIKTPLQ